MIGDLVATLSVDSAKWSAGLKAAQSQLGAFSNGVSSRIAGIVASVAGIGAVGKSLKLSGEFEQTKVAMETLMGSVAKAQTMMTDLENFALKTPFQFTELADISKKMLAMGYSAEQIIPTLTTVGDAVAALGGGGEVIDRILKAFSQVQAKGNLQTQEMNQLAESGIPAWQMLAKALGTDVAGAMSLVESRAVSGKTAIDAILAGMNERFAGGMSRLSKTTLGAWSNLTDLGGKIMRDFGDAISKAADVKGLIAKTGELMAAMRPLANIVGNIIGFLGRFPRAAATAAAALMGIVTAQRAIAAAQIVVQSLSGPKGWAALAAGAAIATVALRDMQKQFDLITTTDAQTVIARPETKGLSASGATSMHSLTAAVKDATEPAYALNRAISEIVAKTKEIGTDNVQRQVAVFESQLRTVTGVGKAIEEARIEAAKLNGTYNEMRATLDGFVTAGITGGQLSELRAALEAVPQARIAAEFKSIENAISDAVNGIDGFGDKLRELAKNGATQSVLNDFTALQRQLSDIQSAKSLEESLVTPAEKLERELSRIRDLEAKGMLSAESAKRATTKARADFASSQQQSGQSQSLGAVTQGSREAFAAIARAMRENDGKKMQDIAEKQLETQQAMKTALEKSSGAGGGGADVVIYGGAL